MRCLPRAGDLVSSVPNSLRLWLRAAGEQPGAADASGVPVFLIRYVAVIAGGGLAGLAGAYFSVVYTQGWAEGMTNGRGWIAIALVIFGTWILSGSCSAPFLSDSSTV